MDCEKNGHQKVARFTYSQHLHSIAFCCSQTQNTGFNRPLIQLMHISYVLMFSMGRSFFLLGTIYKTHRLVLVHIQPVKSHVIYYLGTSNVWLILYSGLLVTVLPCSHPHLLCRASFHSSETVIKMRGWGPGHLGSSPLQQGTPNPTIFVWDRETWPAIQQLLILGWEPTDFLSLSLSKNTGNKIYSFCSWQRL